MSDLTLGSAADLRLVDLAALFTASFAGYAVPMTIGPAALAAQLRVDGVDLARSRIAAEGGAPVGLLLLAPRGWCARVAAMGVVAPARRRGVGRRLVDAAIADLEAAGLRELRLEVIADNQPAIELYRRRGFRATRRLVAHVRPGDAPTRGRPGALVEVDPREVAAAVARDGAVDLPWPLRAESLVAHGPPARGWALEGAAWALTTVADDGALVLLALVVAAARRRQGLATALLAGLDQRFPGRSVRVPARAPEGLAAEFLAARGFERAALSQLEMVRPLGDAALADP